MVSPSKRFEPIQRIASSRERKAAAALGDTLKARQDAEQRLTDLYAYRAEYLERYRQARLYGANAAQLKSYQGFLDKLELAITEQEGLTNHAQARCADSKLQWRDDYTRTRVMANVMERLRRGEQVLADKREQADQDERNQRRR